METAPNTRECPKVSAEERAKHDLIKQILKLRWMGMEKEAEQLIGRSLRRAEPGIVSLLGPLDTD